MRKLILGLTAAAVLASGAFANQATKVSIQNTKKIDKTFDKEFKNYSKLESNIIYNTYKYIIKPYLKKEGGVNIDLYSRFNNFYSFLKQDQRLYYEDLDVAVKLSKSKRKLNLDNQNDMFDVMDAMAFKKSNVEGLLKARQYRGQNIDVKYSVIKRINHTAVTISRDFPVMLVNFQNFMIRLRSATPDNKEFNNALQNLALIFHFFDVDVSAKPYFALHNILLDEVLSYDDMSKDFLTYFAQFLAHDVNFETIQNKKLAKLANYIALEEYDKAVNYVKNFDKDNKLKNLILLDYAATQELLTKKIVTHKNRAKIDTIKKLIQIAIKKNLQ